MRAELAREEAGGGDGARARIMENTVGLNLDSRG